MAFIFLIVSFSTLFAAGPMLHLWVAERFCEICNISNKDVLQGIIVGAEFPDIRYMTHDPRTLTTLSGKAHGFNRGMRASISCPFLFIPLAYFPIGCRFSCFRNCLYQTAKTKKLITQ